MCLEHEGLGLVVHLCRDVAQGVTAGCKAALWVFSSTVLEQDTEVLRSCCAQTDVRHCGVQSVGAPPGHGVGCGVSQLCLPQTVLEEGHLEGKWLRAG